MVPDCSGQYGNLGMRESSRWSVVAITAFIWEMVTCRRRQCGRTTKAPAVSVPCVCEVVLGSSAHQRKHGSATQRTDVSQDRHGTAATVVPWLCAHAWHVEAHQRPLELILYCGEGTLTASVECSSCRAVALDIRPLLDRTGQDRTAHVLRHDQDKVSLGNAPPSAFTRATGLLLHT